MTPLSVVTPKPIVIDVDDPNFVGGELIGKMTYDDLLATGDDDFEWDMPSDEWQAIALNYTSGTTGNPKGVVYHHRGAHLNALSNVIGFLGCHRLRFLTFGHCRCSIATAGATHGQSRLWQAPMSACEHRNRNQFLMRLPSMG